MNENLIRALSIEIADLSSEVIMQSDMSTEESMEILITVYALLAADSISIALLTTEADKTLLLNDTFASIRKTVDIAGKSKLFKRLKKEL